MKAHTEIRLLVLKLPQDYFICQAEKDYHSYLFQNLNNVSFCSYSFFEENIDFCLLACDLIQGVL